MQLKLQYNSTVYTPNLLDDLLLISTSFPGIATPNPVSSVSGLLAPSV